MRNRKTFQLMLNNLRMTKFSNNLRAEIDQSIPQSAIRELYSEPSKDFTLKTFIKTQSSM